MNYEIRYVRGHVEVYDQMGRFRFSADSEWEALEELKKDQSITEHAKFRLRLHTSVRKEYAYAQLTMEPGGYVE